MSSMTLSSLFDALLLDLDGTVWAGELALPGSVESIVASQLPALYITNNASRGPADVAAKLRAAGLDASPEDVVTSAQAAVSLVAAKLMSWVGYPAGRSGVVITVGAVAAAAGALLALVCLGVRRREGSGSIARSWGVEE